MASIQEMKEGGTSLVVQWLRLCASNAGSEDKIPGRGTKILHAPWRGQKKKKKSLIKILNHYVVLLKLIL